MKLITQVYIDVADDFSSAPNYQRLDMFDFESIELTSSIQEVRDIGSVFTDFSQEFNIPASVNNNNILKHFYSLSIIDGFDARIKRRGYISLNGIMFREGYIRLRETSMKKGKPYSYKLTFFGQMVSLTDIIGDDKLSDLTGLDKYNHEYKKDVVWDGFTVGLGFQDGIMKKSTLRDVVYPSISAENKWYYDSSEPAGTEQVFKDGISKNILADDFSLSDKGILFTQLKPSIKIKRIIEAIEDTYSSINFSNDFFSNADFNNLYMLLHSKKGTVSSVEEGNIPLIRKYILAGENKNLYYTTVGSDEDLLPLITSTKELLSSSYTIDVAISSVIPVGTTYDIFFYADGEKIEEGIGFTDSGTLTVIIESKTQRVWDNLYFEIKSETLDTFDVDVQITREYCEQDFNGNITCGDSVGNYVPQGGTQSMLTELIINKHIPEIRVLDFLKGIFNMFNLTAYVENGIIVVKTLNNYYLDGVDNDISLEIDTTEHTIKRCELYSNIEFMYEKPSTFGMINQNETQQDDYGNLEFQATENGKNNTLIFDGTNYKIKLPFEKLFYERLSDESDTTSVTPFSQGWLVDKDQNAVNTKPILFFNIPTVIDTDVWKFGFKDRNQYIPSYNRPSNTTSNGALSLHFGEETDEYTNNLVSNSLFKLFYQDYIINIYDKTTRLINYKAKFNLSTLLRYEMNDKIIVNNNKYRINKITTNLTSGDTDLELITDFNPITLTIDNDTVAPTSPTDLSVTSLSTSSFSVSWTSSTDNLAVTGYKVYLDGVLNATLGVVNSHTISGLLSSTLYSVEVSAIDGTGNESVKSNALAITTLSTPDTTPPSQPTNLAIVTSDNESITFSWTESVDNVGVTGYEIYLDGVLSETISPTSSHVSTGLTQNTSYDIKIRAFDAANNYSTFSTEVSMSTTNITDFQPPSQPQNVSADEISFNNITVSWDASTDNVGVVSYKVYVDDVVFSTVTDTFDTITGLSGETTYKINISALDAEGNESLKSVSINPTTL